MNWIMIIIIPLQGGFTAEFESKAVCEQSMVTVIKHLQVPAQTQLATLNQSHCLSKDGSDE